MKGIPGMAAFGLPLALAALITAGCESPAGGGDPVTYTISGTVSADDGGSAAGAVVQLASGGAVVGSPVSAGDGGGYAVAGVAAGTYSVTVSLGGYETGVIPGFVVTGDVAGKDVKLHSTPEQAAQTVAAAFSDGHAGVLSLTADTVTAEDQTAVKNALAAYNALGDAAQDLLRAEKEHLDRLQAKIADINTLQAVATFRDGHAGVLSLTADTVTTGDRTAVESALAAHKGLSDAAQALLRAEKEHLDRLQTKIADINASLSFKDDHGAILGKAPGAVSRADRTAVENALAAHNALSAGAQALATAEKTKLAAMKARINLLGGGVITLYPADEAAGALSDEAITVYKSGSSGPTATTLEAAGAFDTYRWRVDGEARGNGATFALNAADYTLGIHRISLEVTLNNRVYSKSAAFTVVEY